MTQPVTELDQRFSDPGALVTTWKEAQRVLEQAELFWITTVRADGRPHVTPLVAVWLDGAVHFCTGPSEQKTANLGYNSHVVLTTGCNTWDRGLDVVVEGEAAPVTDGDTLRRLAEAWVSKWDGRWRFEAGSGVFRHEAGEALVYAVMPTKVLAFSKGSFSQTRHTF
jgi:hypothetical protein